MLAAIASVVAFSFAFDWYKKRLKRRALAVRFGSDVADRVMAKQFWLGATEAMIVESLGRPVSVVERVTEARQARILRYRKRELTFEDGALVAWTTSADPSTGSGNK